MQRFLCLLLCTLWVTSCGGSPKPSSSTSSSLPPVQASVVTVPDMMAYLVQSRCPDGSIPTNCTAPSKQLISDPVFWRRQAREQLSDSVLAENNTAVQTFAFAPYGKFVAADGDGGQVIATTADSAVI